MLSRARERNWCVLLASILVRFSIPIASFAQEYNFTNLSVADGLAQSQVYAICEDRRGNIWFGTRGGGVSRYDGFRFSDFSEENGLPSNYICAILEDRTGDLWFGTDLGVCRYDGRTIVDFTSAIGLSPRSVNAITQDSSGALWFGSQDGGVIRYLNGRVTSFTVRDGLPSTSVHAFLVDRENRVWVATSRGAAVFEGGRFTEYTSAEGLTGGAVTAIVQDVQGEHWFATYGNGLFRYDGRQFTRITVRNGLNNNTLLSMIADPKDGVWVGTAGGGVDRVGGAATTYYTEREGLCNNVVTAILRDSGGNIWFGSSGGGVSRLDGERFLRITERGGALGNWVYTVGQDRNGNMWFGSSVGGVVKYDGSRYTRFSERDGFTAAKVKCVFEDSAGVLWFGTVGRGLYTYDGVKFRHLNDEGLLARFVNAVVADRHGTIWLASSDFGVVRFRSDSGSGAGRFDYIGTAAGLRTDRVYDVGCGDDGTIWAATDGGGIGRISYGQSFGEYRITNYTASDGIGSNTIRSIARGRGRELLFGTGGGGVLVYDGRTFRSIRKSAGISSDNIYSVILDRENRIWVGSERGIDMVVLDTSFGIASVRHYGKAEGVVGVETSQNAVCIDSAGNIWFGTIHGVLRYNPREDRPNRIAPKTHLTEIRLFFDRIDSTRFVDTVMPWYPIPVGLTLPYDQNNLSFSFVGINQRNPTRVRYRWKLEGFDPTWSPSSEQNRAVYSNLPPGDYTFFAVSYNEDGIGDPTPARFDFSITPPFWERWWFRVSAALAVVIILGLLFRARIGKLRREAEAERHEIELRGNIVELQGKSLRLSMNPHFIFNALNSIQAFIVDNNPVVARRYLTKFSRLMRLILENSREVHVPLESEMAMLRSYLDLERMNMEERFDYTTEVGPKIDPASIGIPPMLIQPFVENAVLHGMKHKQGKGCITVRFTLGDGVLHCTIDDDGIGRFESARIRDASSPEHVSTALAVTRERLAIMSRQAGVDAGISIIDLVDASGNSTGTRVDIRIPYVEL